MGGAAAVAGRALQVLVGPTASGKSAVAQAIAEQTGAAVLSADSMLIYRGMDIGTAKPSQADRARVPYFGVDLAAPEEAFSVWQYRQAVISQLAAWPATQTVIVTGGSGLYVRALIDGLDTAGDGATERAHWDAVFAAQGIEGLQEALRGRDPAALGALADARNPRRLIRALERCAGGGLTLVSGSGIKHDRTATSRVLAGLRMETALLNERIERRVEAMYTTGLLEEVARLLDSGRGFSPTARQAIGYAEAIAVLGGDCSRDEAVARTAARTRQLAKRQRTWFRHQVRVEWVDVQAQEPISSLAARVQEIWRTYGSTPFA